MRLPLQPSLVAVLAGLLGAVTVTSPAVALDHAFEHLASSGNASESRGHDSPEEGEGQSHCGLCLSLAQGRAALVSPACPASWAATPAHRSEVAEPISAPRRAALAADSPRAPPLLG